MFWFSLASHDLDECVDAECVEKIVSTTISSDAPVWLEVTRGCAVMRVRINLDRRTESWHMNLYRKSDPTAVAIRTLHANREKRRLRDLDRCYVNNDEELRTKLLLLCSESVNSVMSDKCWLANLAVEK